MASKPKEELKKIIFYKYEFVKKHGSQTMTGDNNVLVCCRKDVIKERWNCNNIRDLNAAVAELYDVQSLVEYYWISKSIADSDEIVDVEGSFDCDIDTVYTTFDAYKEFTILKDLKITQKDLLTYYVFLVGQEKVDSCINRIEQLRTKTAFSEAQSKEEGRFLSTTPLRLLRGFAETKMGTPHHARIL